MPRVTLYTNQNCIFCQMAKRLLATKRIAYREIDLAMDHDGRQSLVELTGRMTFPQVLIDDEPIGGYVELLQRVNDGSLPHDDRRAA